MVHHLRLNHVQRPPSPNAFRVVVKSASEARRRHFSVTIVRLAQLLWEEWQERRMNAERNEELARLWTGTRRVGAYILSLVPDFHQSEEIVQRVAVALVRKFDQYDAKVPFVAWAIRVAQYEVMYYRRQRATDRHVFDEQLMDQVTEAHVRLAEEATPAEEALRECLEAGVG